MLLTIILLPLIYQNEIIMITLKHKKTGSEYYVTSTFPNNRGEITLYVRSGGYHSMPKLLLGTTVYDFLKDTYPMLEVIDDTNLDRVERKQL